MPRTLLVDQETRVHEAVSSVLKPMGHDVTAVLDIEAAMEAFERCKPQIVIAEAELSGTDLLRRIRRLDSRSYVILTTAFPRKEVAISALRAGAFDFLLKPLNVKDLWQRSTGRSALPGCSATNPEKGPVPIQPRPCNFSSR